MKLISLIFTLLCQVTLAQEFYNLDFEVEAEKDQPRVWYIEGEGQYTANLTTEVAHHGKRSLAASVSSGQVVAYLSLTGSQVDGKLIEVSAHIKSPLADSLQMLLAFKDPVVPKPIAFPVEYKSANQWTMTSAGHSFNSYTSDRLLIAIIISGKGKVFIDDFELKIDGKTVGGQAIKLLQPDKSILSVLSKHAIPFDNDHPMDSRSLRELVGNARVIALGENSHGSTPVYKTKLSIIKELVEQNGFEVFALESPREEAEAINRYVAGGDLTRKEILDHLVYPAWKTREMLAIIDWLRTYNKAKGKKVQFIGFDVLNKENIDRDRVMAEHVMHVLESAGDQKIILSADNTHITKSMGKMGYYLRSQLGENYVPIGFTFARGTYSAYGPHNPYHLHLPYVGSAEDIFDRMSSDNFVLDLRSDEVHTLLNKPLGFRSIGSRPQETTQFAEIKLPDHFDIIVYIDTSSHTQVLTE